MVDIGLEELFNRLDAWIAEEEDTVSRIKNLKDNLEWLKGYNNNQPSPRTIQPTTRQFVVKSRTQGPDHVLSATQYGTSVTWRCTCKAFGRGLECWALKSLRDKLSEYNDRLALMPRSGYFYSEGRQHWYG